jgi:hypothetical protein
MLTPIKYFVALSTKIGIGIKNGLVSNNLTKKQKMIQAMLILTLILEINKKGGGGMSTVLACDRCGTSVGTVKEIYLWVDDHADPSGNGRESDFYAVDLCENCLFDFFKNNIIKKDHLFTAVLAVKLKKHVEGIK